jgi:hypothetical protein
MIIRQIIKAVEDKDGRLAMEGTDWTAPLPDVGDIIRWNSNAKAYTARVKSRSFSYDKDEVSMGRTDDWGVTITVIVDILETT